MNPDLISIGDDQSGARAEILVGLGFNCFRFEIPADNRTLDVLWSVPGFENGTHRPSGSGIPLLFPFPGRIQGTAFAWQGRLYPLEAGDGRGNAIHGFVHTRPWRLIERGDNFVTAEFQAAVDDPTLLPHWPSDFLIRGTYRVDGLRLVSEFTLANPGDRELPCGFGTHPYFRLPLGNRGSAAECKLHLPLTHRWELQDMVATGRRLPIDSPELLAKGTALGDLRFDDVFSGFSCHGEFHEAAIADPVNQRRLELQFSNRFRECVVYTPDHREAVCIEPYTCVPDAARLADAGVDAGLLVLDPGEELRLAVEMAVSSRSLGPGPETPSSPTH